MSVPAFEAFCLLQKHTRWMKQYRWSGCDLLQDRKWSSQATGRLLSKCTLVDLIITYRRTSASKQAPLNLLKRKKIPLQIWELLNICQLGRINTCLRYAHILIYNWTLWHYSAPQGGYHVWTSSDFKIPLIKPQKTRYLLFPWVKCLSIKVIFQTNLWTARIKCKTNVNQRTGS